jgi:hypothetical protein
VRLCPRGVAYLRHTDPVGRVWCEPYRSRRERAALVQAHAETEQRVAANAAWMAEQARLGYPLFEEPALVTPEQAAELRAWAARETR